MKLATLLMPLALAGCAQLATPAFSRGQATQQQADKDDYQCDLDARNLRNSDQCFQMTMYERCMRSKGYQPVSGTGNKGTCP